MRRAFARIVMQELTCHLRRSTRSAYHVHLIHILQRLVRLRVALVPLACSPLVRDLLPVMRPVLLESTRTTPPEIVWYARLALIAIKQMHLLARCVDSTHIHHLREPFPQLYVFLANLAQFPTQAPVLLVPV
jgi:hypothetical protein